jgi:hypothetical protein
MHSRPGATTPGEPGDAISKQQRRRPMNDTDDFTQLDDPTFLAERRRVREELEHTPQNAVSPETAARYQAMNEEFIRRARLAWAQAG